MKQKKWNIARRLAAVAICLALAVSTFSPMAFAQNGGAEDASAVEWNLQEGLADPNAATDPNTMTDPNGATDPNGETDPNAETDPNGATDPNAVTDPNAATDPNGVTDPNAATDPNAETMVTGDATVNGVEEQPGATAAVEKRYMLNPDPNYTSSYTPAFAGSYRVIPLKDDGSPVETKEELQSSGITVECDPTEMFCLEAPFTYYDDAVGGNKTVYAYATRPFRSKHREGRVALCMVRFVDADCGRQVGN